MGVKERVRREVAPRPERGDPRAGEGEDSRLRCDNLVSCFATVGACAVVDVRRGEGAGAGVEQDLVGVKERVRREVAPRPERGDTRAGEEEE